MQYVTTETQGMVQFHVGMAVNSLNWQSTTAQTETAAKSVAQRNRVFQRTIAHIASIRSDGKISPIAHRIDGKWTAAE